MDQSRRLAAIMFTDIVGYTGMMQADEARAVRALERHRTVMERQVAAHHGEIQNFYGDGSLSLFPSISDAVHCALSVQCALREGEIVPLRIGLHIGEVSEAGDKVYGDAVNIASRIESSGHGGTILLSKSAFDKVRNLSDLKFRDLGLFAFKNVTEPIRLYGLLDERLPAIELQRLHNRFSPGQAWHERTVIRLALVLIVVLLGLFFWQAFPPPEAGPDAGPETVVVFPFTVQGNEQLNYLQEGMVDLLSTKLDGMAGVQALDPNIVVAKARESNTLGLSPEELYQIARSWGGTRFIMGNVIQLGEDLRIKISEYSSGKGPALSAEVLLDGEKDLLSGIDRLVRETVAQNLKAEGQETMAMATLTSENSSALRDYLQGENLRRSGQYERANRQYALSVEKDSTFAMAWLRLAQSCSWNNLCLLPMDEIFERIGRYDDALPAKLQDYVDAMRAFYTFEPPDQMETRFRNLIDTYGENVDFLIGLGEVLYHYNQNRGRMASEAIPYFSKARDYDPGNVEVVTHLIQLLAYEGDTASLRPILESIPEDSDYWPAFQGISLLTTQQPWTEEQLRKILDHPRFNLITFFNECHIETLVPRLIRLLKDMERVRGERFPDLPYGPPIHPIIYAWQGQEKAAWEAMANHPIRDLAPYALLVLSLEPPLDLFWDALQPDFAGFTPGSTQGPFPDDFMLAVLALKEGDRPAYARHLERLRNLEDLPAPFRGRFARAANAFSLRTQGDFQASNRILDSLLVQQPFRLPAGLYSIFEGSLLMARAENEFDLNNFTSALQWYEARFNVLNGGDEQVLGFSLLRRGEICEILDRREQGIAYYQAFLNLFANSDPKYQGWVARARTGLDNLTELLD